MLLRCHVLAVDPHVGPHLERHALSQRIELDDSAAQLVFGPVGALSPIAVPELEPRLGQRLPFILRPKRPDAGDGIWNLVVEQQKATGLEVLVDTSQAFEALLAIAAQTEAAADQDRLVRA